MAEKKIRAYWSRNSDEYATPKELFDELNNEFNFNLDPCSTDENAKCEKHYTKAEDGLKKSWGGGVEYFATRLIAIFRHGLKSVTGKEQKTTPLLLC